MFKRFLGIFLVGLVIKMMDDFLDQDLDRLKEEWNLTILWGRGILPYSLVILILALYFNFSETVSFFSASYLIGMTYNSRSKLPTHLLAWQEGLIVFLISIYLSSFSTSISALILILLIQFIDDFLDYKSDIFFQSENLIYTLGLTNSIIITLILFFLAIKFYPLKLAYFLCAAFGVYLVFWLIKYLHRKKYF